MTEFGCMTPPHCIWSSWQPLLSLQDHRTHRHPRNIPCLLCAQSGQDLTHFTWETVAGSVSSVSASRCPIPHLLVELSLSSDALLFHHLLFHHCHFHQQFPAFPGELLGLFAICPPPSPESSWTIFHLALLVFLSK